ncbi:MAG: octaprenyl-diphosphate synthase [Flavobacteriales bacterium]|jgi:octaprenyl-diphosphate synthase
MLPFLDLVHSELERVNSRIIDSLHSDEPLVENIGHYIVDAGGKRLRPILVLLASKALSYNDDKHIDLAAVIEFIHTATLLHDDVVDISSMRRGRPTANAKWGNAPSVLVGDFLYSRAFQMMVAIGDMRIMHTLSGTTNIIAEGEVQQLANAKNPDIKEQEYLTVIYKKTGALFEAACECGSILGEASPKQREALKLYGYHLGLAFQLIDDLLDYEGDAELLGKNVGDDLAEGKPTLPLIHALENSSEDDCDIIRAAIREGNAEQLDTIVKIVRKAGSIDYTRQLAIEHSELAIQTLNALPESPYLEALTELSRFAVARAH